METFFEKAVVKAVRATGYTPRDLAYKVLPRYFLSIITKYLRVKVEGLRHIPTHGPCIVIANHSGYMGFDALMLGHQIHLHKDRVPKMIAHKLWFLHPEISVRAKRLGMVPATYKNALALLKEGKTLILFPEGEEGNFKPTARRYRLKRFRRGFVRLALATGAPIVPTTVIGAEETHINLAQIRWGKQLSGVLIPIPLNVLPLPAKWKIKFHKPIRLEKQPDKVDDMEYVTKISRETRLQLQRSLHAQLKKRNRVYL